MDGADIQALLDDLVEHLRPVAGIEAIALGGSRARGTATPRSDVDIALYYTPERPLDLDALQRVAQTVDDKHRKHLLTAIGGWGPWINGGGWLHVRGTPVDFLYRDVSQVTVAIEQCRTGEVTIAYQPGHPHGFLTSIYLAEAALCHLLWDPHHVLQGLKAQTSPYPPPLKRTLIERFSWEAGFALQNAHKGALRADLIYVAGCCFRSVSCLLQTLFALNERYWMNEKGALALATTFPQGPQRLAERVTEAFATLSPHEDRLVATVQALEKLVSEVVTLLE
jgi:predicted nucleotidyltransferase